MRILFLSRDSESFSIPPREIAPVILIRKYKAGRSLEEMDEIFHDVSGAKGAFDVVHVAKHKPRRYGKKGELLIAYDDTPEAQNAQRRRSSVAGGPDAEKSQAEHVNNSNNDSNGGAAV